MSISGIFVYQFRPTILSKLNRTISSSDENSIRRFFRSILGGWPRPGPQTKGKPPRETPQKEIQKVSAGGCRVS